VDDSDEELDLGPYDHGYLDAIKTQQKMDRMRSEYEARARATQEEAERRRQADIERARELERRQIGSQDARQRALERQMQQASSTSHAALERDVLNHNLQNLHAEHMREQQQRNKSTARRSPSRSPLFSGTSVPVDVHRPPCGRQSASPPPKADRIPEPKSQPPQKPVYTKEHETAASVIQQKFRIHQSLRTINDIASEFQTLKNTFVYPSVVEFQKPGSEGGHIPVPITRPPLEVGQVEEVAENEVEMVVDEQQPKLAYTSVNHRLHSYVDAMEKLLMRLDGVESWGDKGVRDNRRSVVKEIGKESEKLERYWKKAWAAYLETQKEETQKEAEEQVEQENMEVDDEPVQVEHPNGGDSDGWLDVAELEPALVTGSNEAAQIERTLDINES
jgi:hypothetical protein